jgi:hypothetical protein
MTKPSDAVTVDIGYIKRDISEIKQAVKELAGIYVPTIRFEEELKAVKLQIESVKLSAEVQAKRNNVWAVVSPVTAAAFSSAVTFLLIQYLQSK